MIFELLCTLIFVNGSELIVLVCEIAVSERNAIAVVRIIVFIEFVGLYEWDDQLPDLLQVNKKKYIYDVTEKLILKYLERIGISTVPLPTKESLFMLQKAHLMAIPFENIDIYKGVPIRLSNTFEKIVDQERGGFCYELNGLFYRLLSGLGYDVKMVSVRVINEKKDYGPEFDHMALIVSLEDEYLVDVGFGDFSTFPLKLVSEIELNDPAGVFKFEKYDDKYLTVNKRNEDGTFVPHYIFTLNQRQIEDFLDMCLYHQTSPDSKLTQGLVCSILTETGRITMTDKYLKIFSKGVVAKSFLKTEEEIQMTLFENFRIRI